MYRIKVFWLVAGFTLVTLLSGYSAPTKSAAKRRDAEQAPASSLVYVYPPGETQFGPAYSGTGFFVNAAGAVLTAAHVVPGEECTLQVETSTGSLAVDAYVHFRDAARDVVLLKPVEPLRTRVRAVSVSATPFREGSTYSVPLLYALDRGWPDFKASKFLAECVAVHDNSIYLDTKLPGSASGGPVLDAEGRVGAMVVSARALPMQLGRPAVDDLTTGSRGLPQSEQWFFVVKAVRISSADVGRMVGADGAGR